MRLESSPENQLVMTSRLGATHFCSAPLGKKGNEPIFVSVHFTRSQNNSTAVTPHSIH